MGVVALALVAGVMTAAAPVAHSAIVSGSIVQFAGTAVFSPTGNIEFVTVGPAPAGSVSAIRIGLGGNTGSFAGYTEPNPVALPIFPNYIAGFNSIVGGAAPAGNFILLPAVVVGGGEPGPAVSSSRFQLSTWTTSLSMFNGIVFLGGVGLGTIIDDSDGSTISGVFSLSSQNFNSGLAVENSFSATLQASVIPVPGALWLLASGVLGLLAVVRRR